ncbi:MAG: ribosome biogenesis GTPase Der [Deltaproteobacteria bacterium]|nr:ribosome biogenesis GTPase Der [Deltaproteobacteria bacterium]
MSAKPLVAIVGRPNVGKSTLFNRMIRRLRSIVADEPGVTRDRIFSDAVLNGPGGEVPVVLIDTGGLDPDTDDPIMSRVFDQTQLAIDEADAVILLVDGRAGLVPSDAEVARMLRRSGKPVILAVNKIEGTKQDAAAAEFSELAIEPTIFVSAAHGRNVPELADAVVAALGDRAVVVEESPADAELEEGEGPESQGPEEQELESEGLPSATRVAVLGRPNAGKSSLVNRLLGEDRHLVSDIAGTTRDTVDSRLARHGKEYVFIDTAGIRRKSSIALRLERYSVFAARKGLESSDVALLLLDATQPIAEQDAKIAAFAFRDGKAVILVVSKWDAKRPEDDQRSHTEKLRTELAHLSYAPVIYTSAHTGFGLDRLLPEIDRVLAESHKRIATGELNRFLEYLTSKHDLPSKRGKHARLYYLRQIGVAPPRFLASVNDPELFHFSWRRHLLNELRHEYGFDGVPILVGYRGRKKKAKVGEKAGAPKRRRSEAGEVRASRGRTK